MGTALSAAHSMVVKTELCNYSGFRIYPGHGKKYVRGDQKMFTFVNAKTERCFKMKRRNLTTKWTVQYRRINKKGTLEETERKRRSKKTVVKHREIVGPSAEGQTARCCTEGVEEPQGCQKEVSSSLSSTA